MYKDQLVKEIAKITKLQIKDAAATIDAFINVVTKSLKSPEPPASALVRSHLIANECQMLSRFMELLNVPNKAGIIDDDFDLDGLSPPKILAAAKVIAGIWSRARTGLLCGFSRWTRSVVRSRGSGVRYSYLS